jgi:hypothetical protein
MSSLTTQLTSRLERKFLVRQGAIYALIARAGHCCLPDPVYPYGDVHSIYYDTPELASYHESEDGDIIKTKYRIRWYDTPPPSGDIPVWIEVKAKNGLRSRKLRVRHSVPAGVFSPGDYRRLISHGQLQQFISASGAPGGQPQLLPVALISYRRHRFLDPESGMGLAIDTDIESSILRYGSRADILKTRLRESILEIKGPEMALPGCFAALKECLTGWTAFSKYARGLDAQMSSGTVWLPDWQWLLKG